MKTGKKYNLANFKINYNKVANQNWLKKLLKFMNLSENKS